MANIKTCDRCKKAIDKENEIGITLLRFIVKSGFVRPSKRLLESAKAEGLEDEYFPIEFSKTAFGEIDLCTDCFAEFRTFVK